jgi:hypothetical protein
MLLASESPADTGSTANEAETNITAIPMQKNLHAFFIYFYLLYLKAKIIFLTNSNSVFTPPFKNKTDHFRPVSLFARHCPSDHKEAVVQSFLTNVWLFMLLI